MKTFSVNILNIKQRRIRQLLLFVFFMATYSSSYADYVKNEPITLTQPNGVEINVFVSGDEYYSWIHDKDGYTIIQNPTTGYYCYALLQEDELMASPYIVGQTDPKSTKLEPNVRISNKQIQEKRLMFFNNTPVTAPKSSKGNAFGTLNNIVIYIRFANQTEFSAEQNKYTSMFNSETGNSMKNFFKEISYGQMNIQSHFYPTNNGSIIVSYQDSHNREYYCPYSYYNTSGYKEDERADREHTLLYNAIEAVKSQIPTSLNLDYDNNGQVDNVCFIIRGMYNPNTLLWSHRWSLYSKFVQINGKRVYDYNVQIEERLNSGGVGTLCHEMGHTFGAPDLYHGEQDSYPIEKWDLMSNNLNPPQYTGAYIRHKYMGWITTIPTISKPGTYTLHPLSSSSNNCYKIPLKNSSEYLVLEYRKKEGTFENQIYGSGLVVYRINETHSGNHGATGHGGINDEVYIFRPGGSVSSNGTISKAHFSSSVKRTSFNASTNPACFISDGSGRNVFIWNIKENTDGTLSFKFSYCGDDDDKFFSNTRNLPAYTKVSSSIQTEGNVVVKSSDNVTFEAAEGVSLGEGFEVEEGGTFNVIIYDCD